MAVLWLYLLPKLDRNTAADQVETDITELRSRRLPACHRLLRLSLLLPPLHPAVVAVPVAAAAAVATNLPVARS
jgi:hypothetical protein